MMIYDIIENATGQKVLPETPIEELNLDSLEFVDLILQIETETGKSLDNGQIAHLQTVGDLVALVG